METFKCQCEHIEHESPSEAIHPDLQEFPTTEYGGKAMYVGEVCKDCAANHLSEYMIER